MSRYRGYVFTWFIHNNSLQELLHPEWDEDSMTYLLYQLEVAPTTRLLHWQGYVEFKHPQSIDGAKKKLNVSDMHLEPRRGTEEQAAAYSLKDETRYPGEIAGPYELGTRPPGQGKRTDIDDAVEMIKERKSFKEVATEHSSTYVRYHKGLHALNFVINSVRRDFKTHVSWYWGASGVGKTRRIYEELGSEPFYVKDPDNKWWDGYDNEPNIVIDDFKGFASGFSLSFMLRLLDRYPLTGEAKGSTVSLAPHKIFVSSLRHPGDYLPMGEDPTQLLRRIENLVNIV